MDSDFYCNVSFRIPSEELKQCTFLEATAEILSFRIPSEELKLVHIFKLISLHKCFRIPSEELKRFCLSLL